MSDLINLSSAELFALAKFNFKNENIEGALVKLKTILARGNTPIEVYPLLGRVYRFLDMLEEAKNCFQFYLSHQPDIVSEAFQLGLCEQDMGNITGAKDAYDSLLQREPNYPPALYQRAVLFAAEAQPSAALSLLQQLIATADENDPYLPIADRLVARLKEENNRSTLAN